MGKNNNKWLDIRKILSKYSERDLIGLVADLYALSQSNKDFLEARFLQNDKILSHYKDLVKKYIAPSEPWKNSQQISLKDAKKAEHMGWGYYDSISDMLDTEYTRH